MHFLIVDEVQDLAQNIITLCLLHAETNVFFSDDTIQTIIKGISFHFYDIKKVFKHCNHHAAAGAQSDPSR